MDQTRSPPEVVGVPHDVPGRVWELPRVTRWHAVSEEAEGALIALEGGSIIFLPALSFAFEEAERRLLDPACSDGRTKNISFDPASGAVRGSSLQDDDRRRLERLLARYCSQARSLLESLFPAYAPHLTAGRASFRPVRIDDRATSFRKDDRRLHVDAFPSQPVQGRRILRVFSNVNPDGVPRVWHVGEPFADLAARFLPRLRHPLPGTAWLLERAGVTKGRRTPYDALMLQLHDRLKADTHYQSSCRQHKLLFPAGSTWIVFTDVVLHAAVAGQYALEQTFYLPIAAMRDPDLAPLRILGRLAGRRL